MEDREIICHLFVRPRVPWGCEPRKIGRKNNRTKNKLQRQRKKGKQKIA